MKTIQLLFCLVIAELGLAQVSTIIKFDTTKHFNNDLQIGVYEFANGTKLVKIKQEDSVYLYKWYNKRELFHAYECDVTGKMHGNSFFLDTIRKYSTYSVYFKGKVAESYTLNLNGDTMGYTNKINDTLIDWMEIRNGEKIIWQTDSNGVNNGGYKRIDIKTKNVLVEGTYRAIRKDQIKDRNKFNAQTVKYNIVIVFRTDLNVTEIPVGEWKYYNSDGSFKKRVVYNWKDAL